jgi:hypothetical protein
LIRTALRQRPPAIEAEDVAAITKVGVMGGFISATDRDVLHLDEAGHVVRALSDAGSGSPAPPDRQQPAGGLPSGSPV